MLNHACTRTYRHLHGVPPRAQLQTPPLRDRCKDSVAVVVAVEGSPVLLTLPGVYTELTMSRMPVIQRNTWVLVDTTRLQIWFLRRRRRYGYNYAIMQPKHMHV